MLFDKGKNCILFCSKLPFILMEMTKSPIITNGENQRKKVESGRVQLTSVSRFEEEKEEKLVDGTCNEYGSAVVGGRDSTTLSLVSKNPSPSGHPIGVWSSF